MKRWHMALRRIGMRRWMGERGERESRWKEIRSWLVGESLILALSYLWYDNPWWFLFLQPLILPYEVFLRVKRRKHLALQYEKGFYDFLQSLLPSLQAGYSLENACVTAYQELASLNGEKHAFVQELQTVVRGIQVHVPVEKLFQDMAYRTENEDIYQFAVILEILKNMGGNSVEILRNSMVRIQKKMETAEEIRTVLSGKVYEKNLMILMPFVMILYLKIMNGSYLDLLYHTAAGQVIMTISLAAIIACFFWTERIIKKAFCAS